MDDKPVEITRIDFYEAFQGTEGRCVVNVAKFPDGWEKDPMARAIKRYQSDKPLAEMLTWCEAQGWKIRRWPGGARAFKGGLHPIRSRGAIVRMRTSYENDRIFRQQLADKGLCLSGFDFALDF